MWGVQQTVVFLHMNSNRIFHGRLELVSNLLWVSFLLEYRRGNSLGRNGGGLEKIFPIWSFVLSGLTDLTCASVFILLKHNLRIFAFAKSYVMPIYFSRMFQTFYNPSNMFGFLCQSGNNKTSWPKMCYKHTHRTMYTV